MICMYVARFLALTGRGSSPLCCKTKFRFNVTVENGVKEIGIWPTAIHTVSCTSNTSAAVTNIRITVKRKTVQLQFRAVLSPLMSHNRYLYVFIMSEYAVMRQINGCVVFYLSWWCTHVRFLVELLFLTEMYETEELIWYRRISFIPSC